METSEKIYALLDSFLPENIALGLELAQSQGMQAILDYWARVQRVIASIQEQDWQQQEVAGILEQLR